MAEFKLSRIRYTWKGQWAAATDYNVDDIVSYGGKSYVSLTQHTASSNFYTDLDFENSDVPPVAAPKWELMMDGYRWRGNWATSTFYSLGDIIKYHGIVYLCTAHHTSRSTNAGFESDKVNWSVYFEGSNFRGTWQSGTYYVLGDVIKIGGIVYRCVEEHTSSGLGIEVDFAADKWVIESDTDSWKVDWTATTRYQVNDLVRHNGNVYRCIEGNTASSLFDTDSSKWELVHSGINLRSTWSGSSVRYSLNDVVKYGGNTWICTEGHYSAPTFNEAKWTIYVPGLEYEAAWSNATVYQPGDMVRYGGYLYISSTNHTGVTPSPAPNSNWVLLKPGLRIQGIWNDSTQYLLGDLVEFGGQRYSALHDNTNQQPAIGTSTNSSYWELVVPGDKWSGDWTDGTTYAIGEIVHWKYKTYRCINVHLSETAKRPDNDVSNTYWILVIVGDSANKLTLVGDIKVYNSGSPSAVTIGSAKTILKNIDGLPTWSQFNQVTKVYYVSPNGTDDDQHGLTLNSPWKSIRYACENVTGPATIFVKTGLYQEILPIKVPEYVALVGDEIRGVVVEPAPTRVSSTDVEYTLEALQYINDIIDNILLATSVSPLYTTLDQDVSNPAASSAEVLIARALIADMVSVIDNDVVPSITGTNTATAVANKLKAKDQLEANKEFIVAQTLGYIQDQHPLYSFDTASCERDLTRYIESITYDIEYPGNYKSVEAANYYANAASGTRNAASNMIYLTDATGLRNVTLKGLTGTLEGTGVLETRRPTAGAYVSFDPGWGPGDSTKWINTRSPYIHNCTTFGTGCIGMKLDGDLHNGGNKTFCANDFTQILSNGIGIWVTKDAKTEIVSVFTYYAHIGYLAENGGKIRATNGNNSYGLFGSISDGVNPTEDPITATVNNRYYDAVVESVMCDTTGAIQKIFYSNAGQEYTSATYSITGAGLNASLLADEFRDNSVFEVRITDPGDSSPAGGGSYLYTTNSAQNGTTTTITIAESDINEESNYLGMRVFITKGKGSGQYGYITAYDDVSKVATVNKESDSTAGWDHITPGTTIQTSLDSTSTYAIEPRVTFGAPSTTVTNPNISGFKHWRGIASGNGKFVAVGHEIDNGTGDIAAYSTDGATWTSSSLPSNAKWRSVAYGNGKFVAVGEGTAVAYSANGTTWSAGSGLSSATWTSVTYGNDRFIAVASGGTAAAYSTDGVTWTATSALPESATWNSVVYGNGKFVAVSGNGVNSAYSTNGTSWTAGSTLTGCTSVAYGNGRFIAIAGSAAYYSLNGTSWTSVSITSQTWTSIAYGNGKFVAVADNYNTAITSTNGLAWTSESITATDNWTSICFGTPAGLTGRFIAISGKAAAGSRATAVINTGIRAQARAKVVSGRISSIMIWEPGSGYSSAPTVTFTDPNNTSDVSVQSRLGNKVLANPSISNAGAGYQGVTTFVTVSGDGYMDSYQLGKSLVLSNLTRIPGPGANLSINGITDYTYKVTSATILEGVSAPYTARLVIIKALNRAESPEHGESVSIREQYSQVRITGHDLLDIGLGTYEQTNFPDTLHPIGTVKTPENEFIERNGGRVFYTSTSELGDFRVGELFAVEQATGTVTLNADFFELQGLEELRLGGVAVGGTGVVIREFSTDSTFTADSNNIIPTQRAIKAFVTRRVSGGGADAITGGVQAGLVVLGPNRITTTVGPITIPVKVNFKKDVVGSMLAMSYFVKRN